jgi:small subunit ribosomal protein S8
MDIIGNMITTIRNGYMAKKDIVVVPHSEQKKEIAQKLAKLGFIEKVSVDDKKERKVLQIKLRYENGEPVLTHLKRVSTPGLRIYSSKKDLKPVLGGMGYMLISTSAGVLTNKESVKKGIGGEVICEVW